MDIQREETGILYHCWRPSCDEKGFIGTIISNLLAPEKRGKDTFLPKPLTHPTEEIGEEFYQEVLKRYGMPLKYLSSRGMRKLVGQDVVSMPILGRYGLPIGHTTKRFNVTKFQKKAIHYLETNVPVLHYATPLNLSYTAVLVEDWLSAEKIRMMGIDAVALLGTTMNNAIVTDIRRAYSTVVLMLDPDAYGKAIQIRQKYALYFNKFIVSHSMLDPKDRNTKDLSNAILQCLLREKT